MKNPELGSGERDRGRCPHLFASTPSFARPLAPRSLPGPLLSHQLVVEHMSQLAESELDGSPDKGPKKQLKVLADALDRTMSCETGARTANMGHAVKARYKGMFGGKPLDDLDMMEQAHDAVASAKKNACKANSDKGEF